MSNIVRPDVQDKSQPTIRSSKIYDVKAIIYHKVVNNILYFYAIWLGYRTPSTQRDDDSWLQFENGCINCLEAVEEYVKHSSLDTKAQSLYNKGKSNLGQETPSLKEIDYLKVTILFYIRSNLRHSRKTTSRFSFPVRHVVFKSLMKQVVNSVSVSYPRSARLKYIVKSVFDFDNVFLNTSFEGVGRRRGLVV